MVNVLNQKVGEFSLIDGAIITASKVTTEELLGRVAFVGNSTYRSGTIKVVGAVLTSMASKNKIVQYMASGLLIDGVEDVIANLKRGMGNNKSSTNNSEVIM